MRVNDVPVRMQSDALIEDSNKKCSTSSKVACIFTAVITAASIVTTFWGLSDFADGIYKNNNATVIKGCIELFAGFAGDAVSVVAWSCLCCCH